MTPSSPIRSTFKHASIYAFSSILGRAIGFIMLPIYANYLRGEGYGIVGMIDVLLSALTILIGTGVSSAMSRFYYERTDEAERKRLISTAIILMFMLVMSVSLPALLFSRPIAFLAFGDAEMAPYVTIAVFTFIAEMTSKNAQAYLLIQQRSILFSALAIARLAIGLYLNIYMIVTLQMGVLGYLYSSLIVSVLFSIVMHIYAFVDSGVHFHRADAKNILRFSVPLIPGYLAFFLRSNGDRIMLRTFLGLTQVGIFEMLFKFATLIGVLIAEPFSKIWGMKQLEICERSDAPATIARMFTFQLAIMLFGGLILSLEIPLILRLLTPEEFWLGGLPAFLAVTSRILNGCSSQLSFGLFYAKRTAGISTVQYGTAGVSLLCNLLLIRQYGILGAVAATCFAAIAQCLISFHLARGYYHIPYEWKKIAGMSGVFILFWLLFSWITTERLGLSQYILVHLTPVTGDLIRLLHIDQIREGRVALKITENLLTMTDIGLRFILSLLFIPVLSVLRVFSFDQLPGGRFFFRTLRYSEN